jgi:hypothetical protein
LRRYLTSDRYEGALRGRRMNSPTYDVLLRHTVGGARADDTAPMRVSPDAISSSSAGEPGLKGIMQGAVRSRCFRSQYEERLHWRAEALVHIALLPLCDSQERSSDHESLYLLRRALFVLRFVSIFDLEISPVAHHNERLRRCACCTASRLFHSLTYHSSTLRTCNMPFWC